MVLCDELMLAGQRGAMMTGFLRVLLLSICACASAAQAQTLQKPTGAVILAVTGKISIKNSPDAALFDRKMLEEIGMHSTRTKTPWTDGVSTFEGPLGRDVLSVVGAKGSNMHITALNDFAADLPVTDFTENDVILALKLNGEYLQVRDKGPIFVIYPFDDVPSLYNEVTFAKSVWQVKTITVE